MANAKGSNAKSNTVKKVTAEDAVVEVAKQKKNSDGVHEIRGIKFRLHPVAAYLVRKAQGKIRDAIPPTFTNKTSGREEANFSSPKYLQDVKDVEQEREEAASNAMMMFGVELLDEILASSEWIPQLRYLEIIDDSFDETNEFAIELAFKKYLLAGTDILVELMNMSGITPEAIRDSLDSFRGEA